MLIQKPDSTKSVKEALSKFHSVVVVQSSEVQQIIRHFYASSALILQMDFKPLVELDDDTLDTLFGLFLSFGDEFNGKSYVVSKTMDRLIQIVRLFSYYYIVIY